MIFSTWHEVLPVLEAELARESDLNVRQCGAVILSAQRLQAILGLLAKLLE